MDAAAKAAQLLARRSSRRQFFKFLGAGSLGAGLWLTLDPPFPCKSCAEGGGCPEGCQTSGEWFCCLNGTPCRQRCSECNCPPGCGNPSCHCFTRLSVPCSPRLSSGDQPCPCPPGGGRPTERRTLAHV